MSLFCLVIYIVMHFITTVRSTMDRIYCCIPTKYSSQAVDLGGFGCGRDHTIRKLTKVYFGEGSTERVTLCSGLTDSDEKMRESVHDDLSLIM